MFDSAILDVAIGMAFAYLLVSTLCTAVREGIETFLKTRATYLEYGIRELLHDRRGDGLAKSLFNHPLIHGLYQGDYQAGRSEAPQPWHRSKGLPSYIPSKTFALALIDLAARGPTTDAASSDPASQAFNFESLRKSVLNLNNPPVQRALLAALDSAQGDFDKARANIEAWYDGAMDRVSGWYKRSTQWLIFAIATIVVCVMNINTITIAEHLYRDQAVRKATVAAAQHTSTADGAALDYAQMAEQFDALRLPIGWAGGWGAPRTFAERLHAAESIAKAKLPASKVPFDFWNDLIAPVVGLLITAFAATLGAPFWFDMLNKIMVIRATVKPHEKSPEEGSEDRQPRTNSAPRPQQIVLQTPAALPPAAAANTSQSDDHDLESCGGPIAQLTADEDLPEATGGVR